MPKIELTSHEYRIMEELLGPLSGTQIIRKLKITRPSFDNASQRIYKKLDISGRVPLMSARISELQGFVK